MNILKIFFPSLFLGFGDDPLSGGGDPDGGNGGGGEGGNGSGGEDGDGGNPSSDLEINGVKLSIDSLKGHEKLKEVFDAYENRQKWQAKLTQESQRIKQIERDAQQYQRFKTDPRFQQLMNGGNGQPQNKFDQIRQNFIQKATSQWGNNIDPNFLSFMGDYIAEISGHKAQEVVDPFQQQYFSEWEKNFLSSHPLAQPGTDQFEELKSLIASGANPEKAYRAVYSDEINKAEIEKAIKKRDEENRKKILGSRGSSGTQGAKGKPKSMDEAFEQAWAQHGDQQW